MSTTSFTPPVLLSRYGGRVLIALLTLSLSACGESTSPASTKTQTGSAPAPTVGIHEVQPQPLVVSAELSGRTAAYRIAEVRPQVSGIVIERTFREGGKVEAGEALYQIDPAIYQANYASAKATLARDEAMLTTARLKVKRFAGLIKIKAVSQEVYDEADAALKEAQANVEMGKATLQTARIALDYTQVSAPIAGHIGRSTITQGALVTGNQATALATIRQLDPIYVDVTQSSAELLRLKKRALGNDELQRSETLSAPVELILEDGSQYAHKGELKFSEVTVDEGTGSVTLRALFPNPEQQLLPGMYVRARVQESVQQQAILVPQQGISRNANGEASALLLNADDEVEMRALNVVRAVGNQWLIGSGLVAGDRVIVDGLQKVRPGVKASAIMIDAANESRDTNSN